MAQVRHVIPIVATPCPYSRIGRVARLNPAACEHCRFRNERTTAELIQVRSCDNPQRHGDVISVHGFNGNPKEYWGIPGSHWPTWIGEALPDVGVWSLGYENAGFKPRTLSVLRPLLGRGFAMPLTDRAMSADCKTGT